MKFDSNKSILIVEDSQDIQFLLAELLEAFEYQVICVSNGLLALDFLRVNEHLPGLILLDLMMPVMDGHQFRQEQMKDERLARIPVAIMTAGGDIQLKTTEIGAQAYLKKPFLNVDTILETVGRFFPT